MHAPLFILYGLVAATSASRTLHYVIPSSLKAIANSNCSLPSEFLVTDFTTTTDAKDGSLSTVHFKFSDPDTAIHTTCQRNSTSTASGPSKNKYACDDGIVSFIYQTTGIAGLTMIERACSAGTIQSEAAGLVQPELNCADASGGGKLCHAKQSPIRGVFDSLEPVPSTKAPLRRRRAVTRMQ